MYGECGAESEAEDHGDVVETGAVAEVEETGVWFVGSGSFVVVVVVIGDDDEFGAFRVHGVRGGLAFGGSGHAIHLYYIGCLVCGSCRCSKLAISQSAEFYSHCFGQLHTEKGGTLRGARGVVRKIEEE